MGKIWNPRASRDTVIAFLRDWCLVQTDRRTPPLMLYDAYLCYCQNLRRHDLTLGEFNDEIEKQGFSLGERYGQLVWKGVGLCLMEDAFVSRTYGARFIEPRD